MTPVIRTDNPVRSEVPRGVTLLAGCMLLSLGLHAALLGNLPRSIDSGKPRKLATPDPVSVVLLRETSPAPQRTPLQEPPQPAARPEPGPSASAAPRAPRPQPRSPRVAVNPAVAPPPAAPGFGSLAVDAPQTEELDGLGAAPMSAPVTAATATAGPASDPPTPPAQRERAASAPEPERSLASDDRIADRSAGRMTVARPQGPAQLEYRIFYEDYQSGNQVATLVLRFDVDADRYRLSTEARASGLMSWIWRGTLVQTSEGVVDPGGLVPMRYFERRGERAPRETALSPGEANARFGDGRAVPAPFGTQDRLSILLQIGLSMAASPDARPGTILEWPLLASSRVEASRWQVEGDETLDIGEQVIIATRVRRLSDEGQSDASIDVWFARDGDPWPIRLRFAESRGRTLDQVRLTVR